MSTVAADLVRWSRKRWIYTIGGVFALQLGLVLFFGRHQQSSPTRPAFPMSIHLATDAGAFAEWGRRAGLTDPTLLALPHAMSVSGPAWLNAAPLDHAPANWTEAPRWLKPPTPTLAVAFSEFLATNVIAPPTIADKPLPILLRLEPNFPNAPLAAPSLLRIEGELASRPRLGTLTLTNWPHPDLLGNSVVAVIVNAEGYTLSAAPVRECGLPEADALALKLASEARYRALPAAERIAGAARLSWGQWIFEWRTVPLPLPSATPIEP